MNALGRPRQSFLPQESSQAGSCWPPSNFPTHAAVIGGSRVAMIGGGGGGQSQGGGVETPARATK
jgi:hypothetical protein